MAMIHSREDLMEMSVGRLVDLIVELEKQQQPKVFISPEQFDAFFRVRGLATSISDVIGGAVPIRETRGKIRREE